MSQGGIRSIFSALALALCVFFIFFEYAFAQGTTTPTTTEPIITEEVVEEPAINEIALSPDIQKRIINLAANISNKNEGISERFRNIAKRLQSRITKMQNEGHFVSNAQSKLDEATSRLTYVDSLFVSIDQKIVASISSEIPRQSWVPIRQIFIDAKEAHTQIKQLLSETVTILEGEITSPTQVNATTSTSTTEEIAL